jgi:hypothetical protein
MREYHNVEGTDVSEFLFIPPFFSCQIDVTTNKNGGIIKQIVKDGSGDTSPKSGDKVHGFCF